MRHPCAIDLIQQVDIALLGRLGQGLGHRAADHLAPADQLLIVGIGQFEPMLGPDQQRHEPRRLGEHLAQLNGIEGGLDGRPGNGFGQADPPRTYG